MCTCSASRDFIQSLTRCRGRGVRWRAVRSERIGQILQLLQHVLELATCSNRLSETGFDSSKATSNSFPLVLLFDHTSMFPSSASCKFVRMDDLRSLFVAFVQRPLFLARCVALRVELSVAMRGAPRAPRAPWRALGGGQK